MAKIYISGPITGNPNYKEQFAAISRMLAKDGHIVIDPSVETEGLSPRDYMRISLARLEAADEILLLPGWKTAMARKSKNFTLNTSDCASERRRNCEHISCVEHDFDKKRTREFL